MEEILEILEQNSRYTDEQIALMAGKTVEEVREAIRDYEEKNIIAGYTTLINWENTGKETVTALIEVKITPQRDVGFDKVAERIYKFEQVKACYLMSSGGFDLTVIVERKDNEGSCTICIGKASMSRSCNWYCNTLCFKEV